MRIDEKEMDKLYEIPSIHGMYRVKEEQKMEDRKVIVREMYIDPDNIKIEEPELLLKSYRFFGDIKVKVTIEEIKPSITVEEFMACDTCFVAIKGDPYYE